MGSVVNAVLDLLYPNYCSVCGRFLFGKENYYVACRSCWREHVKPYTGIKCKACGYPLEKSNGTEDLCLRCLKREEPLPFDGVDFYALYEGLLEYAIRELKFEKNLNVAKVLAEEIRKSLNGYLLKTKADLLTYVPVSKERLKERGYDQCEEILKRTAIPFEKLLERSFSTKRQSKLPFLERKENVKGAFVPVREVKGKRVVVFDDIFTTGETAREAARTLKEAGAEKVFIFTLAYTPLEKDTRNLSSPCLF